MKSVYIHIPFCKQICSYCDFCKVFGYSKFIMPYLNALEKEIKDKYEEEVLDTLYIGGGTPSSLDGDNLNKFFDIMRIFKLSEKCEVTFECNLNDITEELLFKLKANGINRLSIGIQSFNEEKLKFMGRNHKFDVAMSVMDLARKIGFNNINVDLMYGIPGETLKDLKEDLKLFMKLKADHISTYSLIFEDNTLISSEQYKVVDEEVDYKMYETICKLLCKKDYNHYEISNFGLKGFESLHNINYWKNNEYYGFGLGAHGYMHGVRYQNTRSLTKYTEGYYLKEENILSKNEMMENELMLGLRLLRGVSFKEFYEKYGVNMQDVFPIAALVKNGDLIFKDGYISISPDKIYIMNEILLKLL